MSLVLSAALALAGCGGGGGGSDAPPTQVTLNTSKGNIVVQLDPVAAPKTVSNFLDYVQTGFYSNTLFHRVIPGFMVQGGGFTTGMVAKATNAPIAIESNNGLSNVRGAVAMARTSDPNSATSQFFINVVDNKALDYQSAANPGYTVFGKVVSGMDVVDAIAAVPTTTVVPHTNVPQQDVVIISASKTQ